MRKLFIPILLACIIISCSKDEAPAVQPGNNFASEKDKVNAWLEKQKKTADKNGAVRIISLQQNLDFASLIQPAFGADEYLYIIPIREAFGSKNNGERKPLSHLVLFINNETDSIRKGNIVQFISPAPITKENLKQFFTDYYGFKDHTFNGSLAYLTVADEMLKEMNYRDGQMNYYKSISKKQLTGRNATCYEIGWYYFWADGSVTWEAVGEYCDGCEPVKTIHGKTYRVTCGGGGGGGTGGGVDDAKTKLVNWEVYSENMYAEPIIVKAYVQLWGKMVSDEPQGGHFFRTADNGCRSENFSKYGIRLLEPYTQSWHGTQNAYQLCQGTIVYNQQGDLTRHIHNTNTFQFGDVFP